MNPRYDRWRRRTFGITWLVYASYYLTRQSFGVAKVAPEGDPTIALSRQQLGLVDSTFLATYSLGQFVFGPLANRFGSRLILLVGMALSALAAVGCGFSKTAIGLVNGIGSFGAVLGGYLPGVLTTKSDWTVFFQISPAGLIVSAAVLVPLWVRRPPAA